MYLTVPLIVALFTTIGVLVDNHIPVVLRKGSKNIYRIKQIKKYYAKFLN